ncbi:MAG: hypothetical protein AB7Q17_03240 [Phycisphaerae bacterium]
MTPTAHAIVLFVVPAAVAFWLLVLKRRVPTARQFGAAFGLASLGTLAAPMFNHQLCLEGEPRNQWILLGPCLLLVLALARSAAWRRILGGCVFVGMMGLSCHFTDIVHTLGWTGNPVWDGLPAVGLSSLQGSLSLAVLERDGQDAEIPAGWVRESPAWSALDDYARRAPRARRQVRAVWHSPLTGLYRYPTIAQDYWCPGGPAHDAIERIERRDRRRRP